MKKLGLVLTIFGLILLNNNEKCEYCNHTDEVKCECQSGECNCGCIIDQENIINPLIDRGGNG